MSALGILITTLGFIAIAMALLWWVEEQENATLIQQNAALRFQLQTSGFEVQKLSAQKKSFDDYMAFEAHTYIGEWGNVGMFDPDRNMLYVITTKGIEYGCLVALHELGHAQQWERKDACLFTDSNLGLCEAGAQEFATRNSWRCKWLS